MSRLLCVTAFLAGVTVVASGPSAAPPPPKAGEADKVLVRAPQHPVRALVQVVNYRGTDNPRVSLKDVLDALAKTHELPYTVNERAFKNEMLEEVLKTEVAATSPLP